MSSVPYHRRMKAILPERSAPSLARVVALGELALQGLHHPADVGRRLAGENLMRVV